MGPKWVILLYLAFLTCYNHWQVQAFFPTLKIKIIRFDNKNTKIVGNLNNIRKSVFERYLLQKSVIKKIEICRDNFGIRQNWWGDLNAIETRELYQTILSRKAKKYSHIPKCCSKIQLYNIAIDAIEDRIVAKLYTRERSNILVLLFSLLYDFLKDPNNINDNTVDQVWIKYSRRIGLDDFDRYSKVPPRELSKLIIERSTQTNSFLNSLLNLSND